MARSRSASRPAALLVALLAACAPDGPTTDADGGADAVSRDVGADVASRPDAVDDASVDVEPSDVDVRDADAAEIGQDDAADADGTDITDADAELDVPPDLSDDVGDAGTTLPPLDSDPFLPTEGCWSVSASDFAFQGPVGTTTWDGDGPLPTNDWWTSLAWNPGDRDAFGGSLYADPIIAHPDAAGLSIDHARQPSAIGGDGGSYWFEAGGAYDLHVGPVGLDALETRVADATDWIVTATWTDDGARSMRATLGRGTPLAWVEVEGAPLRVATDGAPTVFIDDGSSLAIDIGGRPWGVFGPPGTTWIIDAGGLTADATWVAVAPLPDPSRATFDLLAAHADARPVDSRVSWSYDEGSSLVTTTYQVTATSMVTGEPATPLLTLYPHQWRASSAELAPLSWASARGTLRGYVGSSFTTELPFHGILPVLPLTYDAESAGIPALLSQVTPENETFGGDTYFASGALARLGRFAAIADLVGQHELRATTIAAMERWLEDWFSADDDMPPLFVAHEGWGTLVGYPSSFFTDTLIVDHHFHWGYFVAAAAQVALWDRTWARDDQWGGAVKMLVRDVADPLRDDAYPFLRSFDVYAGHSWAGGAGFDGAGNNQESSSEAMNLASSIVLFGEATGNVELRDLGIWLYVTEASAIGEYWFDVHDSTFPDGYAREVVGILWGSGAAYGTWWTGEPEAIHGINWLPLHGGSLYLGLWPEHLASSYAGMVEQDGGVEGHEGGPDDWVDIVWMMQALYDGDLAVRSLEAGGPDFAVGSGETRAHVHHWIRALNELGRIDPDVLADVPTYAVFTRDGQRSHVAYNARCEARDVTFSDGIVVSVGPRQLVTRRPDGTEVRQSVGTCDERPLEACEAGAVPDAIVVTSHTGDAQVHTAHGGAPAVAGVDGWLCELGEYYAPGAASCVFFFEVPRTPPGTVLRAATLRLQVHEVQDADGDGRLPFGADLYLLGTRPSPTALPADAWHGALDPAAERLVDDLLAPASGAGVVSWDVPLDSALFVALRDALDVGEGYVVLRLSPDADVIPAGWNQWHVLTANAGVASERPTLVLDLETP